MGEERILKASIEGRRKMKSDTEQIKEFAYWYFWLRDPQQAAQKAGLENGIARLGERSVQKELSKLQKNFAEQSAGELAKLGLCRILFSQPVLEDGKTQDSFSIGKCCTGKEAEYQFLDKIKACELLLRLEEMDQTRQKNDFGSLLSALQQGAQEIEKEEGEEG